MPPCRRRVKIDMRVDLWPARGVCGVSGDKQRCDREVAVDMLPRCRRSAGVAGAARRDHDGYSDAPGRPVLPDGGTLPRLAHAEKNSETACSIKGVDAGLNKIEGRDPPRHRRSRASPL